jgi:hypothetical protein
VSEGEGASECSEPPSEGMVCARERRVALARARGSRGLTRPEEVGPDLHELSCEVDDEDGFLAEEEARLGARRRTRGRGKGTAPHRGSLARGRGRANSRGRGTTRAPGGGDGGDLMGVGAGVGGQEAPLQPGRRWGCVWRLFGADG